MRISIVLIIVMALSSCREDGVKTVPLNRAVSIIVGNAVQVTDDSGAYLLEIQLISIDDSRCPINVVCITAGKAVVNFTITGIAEISQQFQLCLGVDCLENTNSIELTVDGFIRKVTLREVNPYPGSDDTQQKEAVIFIE